MAIATGLANSSIKQRYWISGCVMLKNLIAISGNSDLRQATVNRPLLVYCQQGLTVNWLENVATIGECQFVLIHFKFDFLCGIESIGTRDRFTGGVHRGKVD